MRLICFSDIHGDYDVDLQDGDILVFAGDFSSNSSYEDVNKFEQYLLKWKRDYEHILFVFGNHETQVEKNLDFMLNHFNNLDKNIHCLFDTEITINNYKFYGTSWQPQFNDWAFNKTEKELVELYDKIPLDTNILITHCPPYKVLDITPDGKNVGSRALKARIAKLEHLQYHIYGHIHDNWGSHTLMNSYTLFVNCALMNNNYKLVNKPYQLML